MRHQHDLKTCIETCGQSRLVDDSVDKHVKEPVDEPMIALWIFINCNNNTSYFAFLGL